MQQLQDAAAAESRRLLRILLFRHGEMSTDAGWAGILLGRAKRFSLLRLSPIDLVYEAQPA